MAGHSNATTFFPLNFFKNPFFCFFKVSAINDSTKICELFSALTDIQEEDKNELKIENKCNQPLDTGFVSARNLIQLDSEKKVRKEVKKPIERKIINKDKNQPTIQAFLIKNAEKRKAVDISEEPVSETQNSLIPPSKVQKFDFSSSDLNKMGEIVVKYLMPICKQKNLVQDKSQFKSAARNISTHLLKILGPNIRKSSI